MYHPFSLKDIVDKCNEMFTVIFSFKFSTSEDGHLKLDVF